MSSSTQTRGQTVARYDRLEKRVELVKVSDRMSKAFIEVCDNTLQMFSVTSSCTATAISMPSWEDVELFMKSLTPSPSEIFSEEFFKNPLFPVVALHDIATFYGCPPIEALMAESLGLSPEYKENKNVKVHIWFADFLECDKDTMLEVIRS